MSARIDKGTDCKIQCPGKALWSKESTRSNKGKRSKAPWIMITTQNHRWSSRGSSRNSSWKTTCNHPNMDDTATPNPNKATTSISHRDQPQASVRDIKICNKWRNGWTGLDKVIKATFRTINNRFLILIPRCILFLKKKSSRGAITQRYPTKEI